VVLVVRGRSEGVDEVPERYIEDSDEELKVEISVFGRHETIPTFQKGQEIRNCIAVAIGILALITPYILIAVFSGFRTGTASNHLQRGFVMSWLVVGQVFGAISGISGHKDSSVGGFLLEDIWKIRSRPCDTISFVLFLLAVITPSIGGFVVVGLMIKQFGSCVVV
jgi:MFS family permease